MGQVISIGQISKVISCASLTRRVSTLNDLYAALGERKAFERYGQCWNLFPSAFTIADIDRTAAEVRDWLKKEYAPKLVVKREPDYRIEYGELDRCKLLKMLRCLFSLRRDLVTAKSSLP